MTEGREHGSISRADRHLAVYRMPVFSDDRCPYARVPAASEYISEHLFTQ